MKYSFIAFITIFILTSCMNSYTYSFVGPKTLTSEAQEILDLISHQNREILIYSFELSETYNYIDVFLNVYKYGTLLDISSEFRASTNSWDEGNIVITVYKNEDDFNFIKTISNGNTSITSNLNIYIPYSSQMLSTFGKISESILIEEGEEILLYARKFNLGNIIMGVIPDKQSYLYREYLWNNNSFVIFIKAKFSN